MILLSIRCYQWCISPLLGSNCRFYPSCSCYAHTAVQRFGAWRGGKMAVLRLAKCHPWNPGGYDPVPPVPDDALSASSNLTPTNSRQTLHG